MSTPDFYRDLKVKCEMAGITLKDACDRIDVPITRIYQWRHREPRVLTTLRKLENAIDEIKEENKTDSASV